MQNSLSLLSCCCPQVIGFFGLLCWCVFLTANMTIGLDQDLSVPLDSYVLEYFNYMELYLGVGVPVYFVTKGRRKCYVSKSKISTELSKNIKLVNFNCKAAS